MGFSEVAVVVVVVDKGLDDAKTTQDAGEDEDEDDNHNIAMVVSKTWRPCMTLNEFQFPILSSVGLVVQTPVMMFFSRPRTIDQETVWVEGVEMEIRHCPLVLWLSWLYL